MLQRSVALLIETSSGYGRGLIEGVIEFMKERGNWSVILEPGHSDAPPSWLSSSNCDGIIARIETDEYGKRLRELSVPVVDLSAARHVRGIPWADTEDKAISKLAVEHFRDRGFRKLAYCGDAGFEWSIRRGHHFRQIAKSDECEAFEFHSKSRLDLDFNQSEEQQRLVNWLACLPRPIAVMACHDFKAQQVVDACRQLGIAIPTEIAILGVDNDRLLCELCEPTLSSIIPDTKGTGYAAAQLLDRMMDGENIATAQPILTQPLGVELRESTDTLAIEDKDVAIALHYIRRHATENIRVSDVLRKVSISRRTLEHRFQKVIGLTPHGEIHRVRMNRVRELLSDTNLAINEVAQQTGFEYEAYMAATFKRETGMTPTEYRDSVKPQIKLQSSGAL
ncbi:MAG: DNA-binding transcriptional regulator [Planctomycetota bacterium]